MNICLALITGEWGGAETVVYELAKHLRDRGENVSVILNSGVMKYFNDLHDIDFFNIGYTYPDTFIKSNPRMRRLSQQSNYLYRLFFFCLSYLNELYRYPHYLIIRKKIMNFLLSNKIDLIHTHLLDAAYLFSLFPNLGIPIILTSHGEYIIRGVVKTHPLFAPITKLKEVRTKKAFTKMRQVTAVSNYQAEEIKQWALNCLSKDPVIIYNGINLFDFKKDKNSSLKLKGECNLLFPGGSKYLKGGDLLITSLSQVKKEIPNIHLYISGNVPQDHMLRKMVAKLNLQSNVTFMGFMPLPQYRKLLASVDMLVMPSRLESFGIVFLEAMALGKPIIAGNTGGIPEIVKNGRNGILIEPEPRKICDAIIYLSKNNDLRRKMSENNLIDVCRFDWNLITDQYMHLYQEICTDS